MKIVDPMADNRCSHHYTTMEVHVSE